MNVAELLIEAYDRVPQNVEAVLRDLPTDHLLVRPDPAANTIAWLVWHVGRGQDAQIADVAGTEEVWTAEGWAERFGLPLDVHDMGYGHTSEQVAAVRADAQLLRGYVRDVHQAAATYLARLEPDDLDRVVDERWDPPVTLGVRLVSVVADALQHVGQAAYLKGHLARTR